MRFIRTLLVLLSLAVSSEVFAQRLIPGQMSVYFEGDAWQAYGGGAGVTFIKRNYKWDISAHYRTMKHHLSLPETKEYYAGEYDIKAQDVYARFMYKYDVAHNRGYGCNFWLGIGVDAGARLRNPLETYLDAERVNVTSFVYGFSPELALQLFPSAVFSMTFFARPRMMFLGAKEKFGEQWFYPEAGMQFDFCFFRKK